MSIAVMKKLSLTEASLWVFCAENKNEVIEFVSTDKVRVEKMSGLLTGYKLQT